MYFTPQQLAGGPKYSSKTRTGNWNEDIEIADNRYALLMLANPLQTQGLPQGETNWQSED